MLRTLTTVIIALCLLPTGSQARSAEEWLRRSQLARFPGRDMRASFVMYIHQSAAPRLKRRGSIFRLNTTSDLADRLFVIHAPPNFAGLALLSKDRPDAPALQWLYVPVYKRARRAALHASAEAFAGSDFIYIDFGRVQIESGTHRMRGHTEIGGRPCVVIETATTDRTMPYRRLITTLDEEHALPVRLEYFDAHDTLTRRGIVETVAVIDGRPTPVSMSMTNELIPSRSTIKLSNVRYDIGLDPGMFTVESLENAGGE
jgi:hypothetical protein